MKSTRKKLSIANEYQPNDWVFGEDNDINNEWLNGNRPMSFHAAAFLQFRDK